MAAGMFRRGCMSMITISVVLQRPIGSYGEENTLCYMKKTQSESFICVPPSTVTCCNQQLSVERIDVYGRNICKRASKCQSGEGCCVPGDILNVSADYVTSLERTFRSTNCFNNVTVFQLPATSILTSVVVSYSCTVTSKYSKEETTAKTEIKITDTATITAPTKENDTNPSAKQSETGDTSEVTTAVAVSVSIVVVAVVVVVVVILLRRKRAGGSTTMAHDPVKTSTSGTQYVNVVPPTYEQLSRQHTDGEYSELSKDARDCTHGDRPQQGQQWGSRVDQSVYYNETQQACNDGDYVIVV